MNYVMQGMHKVIKGVREHALLFVLLVVLQAILIGALAVVSLNYQIKIFNLTQEVIEPLQQANFDAQSIEQGKEFITQIATVYQTYQNLMKQILFLSIWWLGFFVVGNGLLWVLCVQILDNSWKEIPHQWIKFVIAASLGIGPFVFITYLIAKSLIAAQVDPAFFSRILKYLALIMIPLYFLLMNAFAAISTKSWRDFARRWWKTTRSYKTMLVLVFVICAIFVPSYFIYYFMELNTNFVLMLIASVLFLLVIIVSRLVWIACLREIGNEVHHS